MSTFALYINDTPYHFTYEEVIEMEKLLRTGNVIFLTDYDFVDYTYYDRIANFLAVNMRTKSLPSEVYFDILPAENFDLFIREYFASNKLSYPLNKGSVIKFIDAVYSIVDVEHFHEELIHFYHRDKEINFKMSNLNIG